MNKNRCNNDVTDVVRNEVGNDFGKLYDQEIQSGLKDNSKTMTKNTRYFVSDINYPLLISQMDNKRVFDNFGRYFNSETLADNFIKDNPNNSKYKIVTDGNKILELLWLKLKEKPWKISYQNK